MYNCEKGNQGNGDYLRSTKSGHTCLPGKGSEDTTGMNTRVYFCFMLIIKMICLTTCIKSKGSLYYRNTGTSKSFYGDWIYMNTSLAEYTRVFILFTFIFELGGTITQHDFLYH